MQYIDVAPEPDGRRFGRFDSRSWNTTTPTARLMGSNMQRQAVPLLVTEPPLVATGMEARRGAELRHARPRRRRRARSRYVDADRIEIGNERLSACASSSASTSGPARTRSRSSSSARRSKRARSIADGAATFKGELALGRNVLVGFMAWDGFNFEDAIIISEELVQERHLHLDPHRGVRHRNPRDEAGPRGVHPRYSQRQRKGPAQSGRKRHRAHRHLRAAGRHSGRQGFAQDRRPS